MQPIVDLSVADDKVTFIVGPTLQKFRMNRLPATVSSPVFHTAFAGEWHGKEKIFTLEDEDPTIFHLFLQWLATGGIPHFEEKISKQLVICAKLWVVADRFLVPKFQNEIILPYRALVINATVEELSHLIYLLYHGELGGNSRILRNIVQQRLLGEKEEVLRESGLPVGWALDQVEGDWDKSDIFVWQPY